MVPETVLPLKGAIVLSTRIKELEAIRHVITHHEEESLTSADAKSAIRDGLESIDSAVRFLTHASACEHTHTHTHRNQAATTPGMTTTSSC